MGWLLENTLQMYAAGPSDRLLGPPGLHLPGPVGGGKERSMELFWGVERIGWVPWDMGSTSALPLHRLQHAPSAAQAASTGSVWGGWVELKEKEESGR